MKTIKTLKLLCCEKIDDNKIEWKNENIPTDCKNIICNYQYREILMIEACDNDDYNKIKQLIEEYGKEFEYPLIYCFFKKKKELLKFLYSNGIYIVESYNNFFRWSRLNYKTHFYDYNKVTWKTYLKYY